MELNTMIELAEKHEAQAKERHERAEFCRFIQCYADANTYESEARHEEYMAKLMREMIEEAKKEVER